MLLLKLPAVTWEQLLDGLDIEQRAAVLRQLKSPEVTVDKRSIKAGCTRSVIPVPASFFPDVWMATRALQCSLLLTFFGIAAQETDESGVC